jgi:ribonuclease HI
MTELEGYVDSDWAGDPETRRSTSGFIFKLGTASVSWKSGKQPIVACSTTEAEYIALSEAVREASWLRSMLEELGFSSTRPTTIFEDNQGCISISKNRRTDKRTKHIDIKYHYVRDQVEEKNIILQYCPTDIMAADAMTKAVNAPKLNFCRERMGLVPAPTGMRGAVETLPDVQNTSSVTGNVKCAASIGATL